MWFLVSGKIVKSALRTLKLGLRRVHLCGFPEVIREFLIGKTSFEPSSAMRYSPLATRMCHLHFAPQASSKAHVLVVWLLVVRFFSELHSQECLACSALRNCTAGRAFARSRTH